MKKDIPEQIKLQLKLDYSTPVCILHELEIEDGYFIRVIGDPDNGAYEWLIERPKPTPYTNRPAVEFSNCGYGISEVAFRDGLIAYYGLPNDVANLQKEVGKLRDIVAKYEDQWIGENV